MMRRILATLAVVAAVVGVLGAPVAAADTVPQTFYCAYPGASQYWPRQQIVTVDAPATVRRGVPASVYIKISDAPDEDGWGSIPTGDHTARIQFGGAASGTIDLRPLRHPASSDTWTVEGTFNVTFTTVGRVTLSIPYHYPGTAPSALACRTYPAAPTVAETVDVVA
jgi:hypothetical protein